ncbi:MAG: HPr(Ser) kinase/phosphatase [Lachnospiraceae bacterium]|nr:HPr(Ser) kinase/phosphatase [Lachnospiraceae bacterium]
MTKVRISSVVNKLNLLNLTGEVDIEDCYVSSPDISRPSFQLIGFWEHFEPTRIQVIGNVEYSYMAQMDPKDKLEAFKGLMERGIPAIIYARGLRPEPEILDLATAFDCPVLVSEKATGILSAELTRWLHVELAPMISIHGVLVDVYGEGVLITGESGIGKSEAAIELIKRGHRLVSDDVVEIRKVSDDMLVGMAPEITRHFIELRGIGIIDVKTLFGVEAVKDTQGIDLVIQLEDWRKETVYDRMGLEEQYTEYLGKKVTCYHLPVRPGRNLAVIVECAAVNHRQKKMGYNAAQELYKRVQQTLITDNQEENPDGWI